MRLTAFIITALVLTYVFLWRNGLLAFTKLPEVKKAQPPLKKGGGR
jgi:hypothetical protein